MKQEYWIFSHIKYLPDFEAPIDRLLERLIWGTKFMYISNVLLREQKRPTYNLEIILNWDSNLCIFNTSGYHCTLEYLSWQNSFDFFLIYLYVKVYLLLDSKVLLFKIYFITVQDTSNTTNSVKTVLTAVVNFLIDCQF